MCKRQEAPALLMDYVRFLSPRISISLVLVLCMCASTYPTYADVCKAVRPLIPTYVGGFAFA